jgi:isocitrate dehydrogenase (NAD+)
MTKQKVTLIAGDGIGPEVAAAATRVIDASGANLEWEPQIAGAKAIDEHNEDPLPAHVVESIRRNGVALKGPVETKVGGGFKSITEGLYSGLEHEVVPGVVESLKIITEKASTRIAQFAFEYARRHGRKKVTAVHKANIMKLSDGLFLDCFRKVAPGYPEIQAEEKIIDNMCMQLVMYPERADVLVMENLYGDIVSDLCAGLVGGLGVVPGANLGTHVAVFEAVHGTAPDIAGQDLANPLALIRSGIMMLFHLHKDEEAERIRRALRKVIVDQGIRTRDLGGQATTTQFTDAIVRELEA